MHAKAETGNQLADACAVYAVAIIGGGAAGMMAACETGKRGLKTLILERNGELGKKLSITGGGKCNFTNLHTNHENYFSQNPHFCKSALSRYSPRDFIELMLKYRSPFLERADGQMFCELSASQILGIFRSELSGCPVDIKLNREVIGVSQDEGLFRIQCTREYFLAESLIVTTGGLSYPSLGAGPIGYDVAQSFGHAIVPTRPALVPLRFSEAEAKIYSPLSGLSVEVEARALRSGQAFRGPMLFTHRGISGPAILQASTCLCEEQDLTLDLAPDLDLALWLRTCKKEAPRQLFKNILARCFTKSFGTLLAGPENSSREIGQLKDAELDVFASKLKSWKFELSGDEGYRKAEVTLGGVDTDEVSSKTMESKRVPKLYFAGELLDVTGQLGGYNLQWAWSSGHVAGCAAGCT
ncbi:MAG: NAD(P)/FAD-dependent oxidoreductase [Planctomycetes bacterium]|nr:NAD(P)/FAD-dependent oxidoreductase [Planctomycetota bacterium]